MKRAMARQAEAERERRAKVIAAEGEFQAAERLSQAAGVIATEPGTLTLRTLQTLAEVATEHNSTLVLPIPIEILDALRARAAGAAPAESAQASPAPADPAPAAPARNGSAPADPAPAAPARDGSAHA
jgi:hypothetical protein